MTPAEKLQATDAVGAVCIAIGSGVFAHITGAISDNRDWERFQARRPWHPPLNQHEADSRAAVLDRQRATMFADVLRMTVLPTARFIARIGRKIAAAVRSFRNAQ
jgi:hypothetical protein